MEALIDEVRLLWHTLVEAGERLHDREPVTLGMRGVLEFLLLRGSATVPHIARSRRVSRQHIQGLVNSLLARDLVALETNPAHLRSPLVMITRRGETLIDRIKNREKRFFAQLDLRVGPADLKRAAAVLREFRDAVEKKR